MDYRTFAEQARLYMNRGNVEPPRGPVGGPAAWSASELESDSRWVVQLSREDIVALDRALDALEASRVAMTQLTRAHIDLGELATSVRSWAQMVSDGRGIILVRGFPVERWGVDRAELATWCLGLHLGVPGAQNPQGDLLGHVLDVGSTAPGSHVRLYQTNANIRFHCDYADVVGLMCLRQAQVGGESRVASSIAIHDELWRLAPQAATRLARPVWLDSRDEGASPAVEVTPFAFDGERLRIFYHSDYFRSAARHGAAYATSEELKLALDLFDELASSERFCVSMRLEPGDLQLVSNHTVVHARTDYRDDPLAPRHLLRLWLSLER